ncbi:MAG: hypothetical protein QGG05_14070 [Candidatus Latescibacteria bacterium]|nr:hypothetical protein [Candidatus Latescibacterota bacterium]
METTSTAIPDHIPDSVDADLHRQLWHRMRGTPAARGCADHDGGLRHRPRGEYRALTGDPITTPLREIFAKTISSFNRENPDRYVAVGVQNSVRRAFESNCFKLEWDLRRIEDVGSRSIA